MKKIAAIIPTFNSVKTVKNAIDSLLNQTVKLDQLIVVDNGSEDLTSRILKEKYGKKIDLLSLKKNLGVTGGRNKGIKKLKKYDYVLFFDHDMTSNKHMIANLLKVAESQKEIGIVTPKIYYLSNEKKIWSAGTGIDLWTGQVIFRGGEDNGQYESDEEVQVAPACMLVKKEVLTRIKKFDERYFATYEDTDFCFRAKEKNFKTFYVHKAIAYHDIPIDKNSESKRLLTRMYWIGRNRILFMRDFGNNFGWFILFYPIFALYYLKLAVSYNKFSAWMDFLSGTYDGLRNK